jgi:hypothetical protein
MRGALLDLWTFTFAQVSGILYELWSDVPARFKL